MWWMHLQNYRHLFSYTNVTTAADQAALTRAINMFDRRHMSICSLKYHFNVMPTDSNDTQLLMLVAIIQC
jgi:hypothetical protein